MKKIAKPLVTLLLVAALLVPTIAMLYSSAAGTSYPVELGFNNLFIFEEWASNKNSTTVIYGGTVVGKLSSDIPDGSFTIKKTDTTKPQAYNGHGESKTNSVSNTDYYSITVEPNTTYCFSYNLDRNTANAVTPYLFLFDSSFLCKVIYEAPGADTGANSFMFTTPSDISHIQFRFTLTADGTAEAAFSNLSVTKCNIGLNSSNLFNFNTWADSQSGKTAGVSGAVFADGTVTPNKGDGSIAMKVNAGGTLFTGFSLDTTSGYYTIPVSANTSYVLNYFLVNPLNTDFQDLTPYIVTVSNSGGIAYVGGCGTSGYGKSSCIFTTAADTAYISVVFAASNSKTTEWQVTVKDIELLKAENVEDNKMSPNRLVKTYGEDETYGTLPTPSNIPDGYIFAGWNTREDGLGTRIAADTPVQPQSLTVYPKFEPAVDSLTVVTQPTKTVYTAGEKFDTTGLVLSATITGKTDADGDGATDPDTTFNISSGYYITPEYASSAAGTQTVTVHYGGKTATFTVTVKESDPGVVIVNGVSTSVAIANGEYTFNYSTSAFNRYEVTYKSDSYVSGVATFNDSKTEEFFLEPSENGSFSSYVDKFLEGNTYNQLVKIKFTTLDKDNGNFELVALNTVAAANPGNTVYYNSPNGKYEMGIALNYGGSVSELYDLSEDIYARTYSNGDKDITLVDYKDKLDSGYKEQSTKVNLINTLDRGRYLQQSYYGTGDKPYVQSEYNNAAWPYNPVQGGNVIGEASKIIDYKVTNDYVYVKARPLDWAKWSDEYAAGDARYEAIWGDDYITDTYVEAWYYFQGDTIKVTNRKVDYSGLPEASHSQEFPALYLIEPLNHFVYNNVSAADAWKATPDTLYNNSQFIDYTDATRGTHWSKTHNSGVLVNYEEPEYWGLTQLYKDKFGMQDFEPWVNVNENWAAFTASEDQDSFGVGLYTDTTTKFYYGVQPTMYQQTAGDTEGSVGSVLDTPEYRHAQTVNPSPELPTSYIAPTDTMLFRSYEPTEFTYYLTTGTASDIRENFREIYENSAEEEAAKPKIAVPETVYLNPADNKSGQYYATNILNPNNYYSIETKAEYTDMYLGVYTQNGHSHISVNVENVDDPDNDVDVCASGDHNASYDGAIFTFNDDGDGNANTFIFPAGLDLDFDTGVAGLQPGETATVKWTITTYAEDPNTNPNCEKEVYTAYTVMYAPGRTVGAVAESRQVDASQNEVSSWITGANGVDHSKRAPLGSYHGDYHASGYFKADPLYNNVPSGGSGETPNDYIIAGTDYDDNSYVLQTATNGHDSSRAQSYLGLLMVDKSRYISTDQIPNLKIGWDALRVGSWNNDSFKSYNTYYTLGTEDSYTATSLSEAPSGWTSNSSYTELANSKTIPYRETIVPSFKVSEIDGKYIHAIAQGRCFQTGVASRYATAGTSVLISVTDKSELRDAVTDGYGVKNPSDEFLEKLEEAATILGTPGASQDEIDQAVDNIYDYVNIFYALKYDNLFSAYEMSQFPESMKVVADRGTATYKDGAIVTVNDTITAGEAYTSYGSGNNFYKVNLNPNTEYVFEYDVTTNVKSQAFMFFYNASGGSGDVPTNMSIQTNGGAWSSKTESNPWWGNYGNAGTYHYVIKFTTGANTTQAAFRFGNTTNDPCESTFSNIKLIDADRYYADAVYEKVEDVYKEYTAYGALQVPVRKGYTFKGWFDEAGNSITAIDTATEHKSIYSEWEINNYTITYDANGGNVSPQSQNYTVENTINLPTPTRNGYAFQGWLVTEGDGLWTVGGLASGAVPAGMYGNATLTAQWSLDEIPVYFDTILDFDDWNTTTASNATFSNVTANGFTLTSNADAGEGTSGSPFFAVEPGKSYKIDMDITGDNWDVYIFFCDANGAWVDFNDGTNRYASNGHGPADRVFTAPNKSEVVKAQIRVDANGSSNAVTFSDIRVYEAGTRAANVNVPDSNMTVQYGDTFGTLPVPTREGYEFVGWYDESDNKVTTGATVTYTSAVYLKSKWVITDAALVSDNVVVDFGSSIIIKPLDNDTIFNNATGSAKALTGFSTDGTNPAASLAGAYGTFTLNGTEVTYTPSKTIDGIEVVYYHASLTADNVTTVIKSQITVAPASNVLYEENAFATTNASGLEWAKTGTTGTANQETSTANDIYGYDSSYKKIENYSNGSALKVEVTETNKRSRIISFDFAGTGFDLNSVCGSATGVQIVTLKNKDTGKMVKSYIVDTYYSDFDGEGVSRYGETLYQVPVISDNALGFANYTVQVVASWLPSMSGALNTNSVETQTVNGMTVNTADAADNAALRDALAQTGLEYVLDAEEVSVVWFDEDSVLNGGEGVNTPAEGTLETAAVTSLLNVVDSVRVYNPIEDGNSYYIASEQNVQYYNIIDNLVNVKTDGTITPGEGSNFAYVSGNDANEISVEEYAEIGPKDELYLSKASFVDNKAVTFTIKDFDKNSMKAMISLRAASGTPKAKIGFGEMTIKSNTEMYYNITDYVDEATGTVTIQNTEANTLLAVGSLKLTSESLEAASLSDDFDLMTARVMMMAPSTEVDFNAPSTDDDVVTPDDGTTPGEDETPDDGTTPDEDTTPDDGNDADTDDSGDDTTPDDTTECCLIRFFKWLFGLFTKLFDIIKGIFSF